MNQYFMSLLKNNSKLLLVLFLVFSSFWIYKIFYLNLLIGIVLIIVISVVSLNVSRKKVLFVCLILLLFLQYQTTEIKSLLALDNDQQRVQQERIRSYPLTYINLYFKVIWLKPDSWIEQNKFVIALSKIEENFFENLDFNKYFFGGFPRNNPSDFQKFIFILLPVFIIGVLNLVRKKDISFLILLFAIPILFLSTIGNDNALGPFSVLPFFIISMVYGIDYLDRFLKHKAVFRVLAIIVVLICFSIQLSYG